MMFILTGYGCGDAGLLRRRQRLPSRQVSAVSMLSSFVNSQFHF
jgi:hypothetical protein